MKILISTDDLNLELKNEITTNDYRWIKSLENTLLNQTPLSLGQFIETDLEGNVLEKPTRLKNLNKSSGDKFSEYAIKLKQYQEAEKRVLFKVKIKELYTKGGIIKSIKGIGHWTLSGRFIFSSNVKTFQDLIPFNLTLK